MNLFQSWYFGLQFTDTAGSPDWLNLDKKISKQGVDMSNHNIFRPGAHVGMPDLANCSHCDDAHNPGVEDAKLEMNLQLVDVGAHITSVMNSMLGLSSNAAHRSDFLSTVSLDSDLTPLQDAGYNTASINKGDIIEISNSKSRMTKPPAA